MRNEVIITCAVTGDDRKVTKSPYCAVTPSEIAESALAATDAGAAIVHIHVRDPLTGDFSMETRHYREVMQRIREKNTSVIINLTCGMGGYIQVDLDGNILPAGKGTDFVSQERRMRHLIELVNEGTYVPEICTIDCGSLNFGEGNRAYVSTPEYIRQGLKICRELGVKPELEVFDTGNLWFCMQMFKEGLVDEPMMLQLCTTIPYGMPANIGLLASLVSTIPPSAQWASFGIGRMQMPMVAQSVLLGGHVRVGLEDNLYLSKGVYASNAQLVERARSIIESLGASIASPDKARDHLKLAPR
ncbi:3-keto-5-aminohexanoate cleavage protein [Mesorhizobium caraganae]|uniref:3-keto-5-aminohexanoate cleavage protein n=1 Tax=Mesorhizobium caraganae TaxID=483206 RepID=UPI001780295B|nr:3-keto-5-aminohexanoate cleavage protein [Mesorhizobium caraganae]